jgi:hypothetical protein
VLPLFKRKSRAVERLPELYLHGPGAGDFQFALREKWQGELAVWQTRHSTKAQSDLNQNYLRTDWILEIHQNVH